MEDITKKKRIRKISSWMTDASNAIENEDELFAGKKIVLKILRFMEEKNISQKDLAKLLGVTPQYINKFLHGVDCDIKVSTAIRYGKILNLKLIEIPNDNSYKEASTIVIFAKDFSIKPYTPVQYTYHNHTQQQFKFN